MSLFERMVGNNRIKVFQLKTNYRMHPGTAEFVGVAGESAIM